MKGALTILVLVACGFIVGGYPAQRAFAQSPAAQSPPVQSSAVQPMVTDVRLTRWVVSATGITVPKNGSDAAVYEVVGVTNTETDTNVTCDLHVDNHSNPADGATITMTDPATPFALRSGDTVTASGDASCVFVLTVFSGYPPGESV